MSQDVLGPETLGTPLALHLVEEISHRVVNEYQEAIAILAMAASRKPPAVAQALTVAAERLRAQAEAHRALLAPRVAGLANVGDHAGRLCAAMARASLNERQIHLSLTTDEIWLGAGRCWRLGLILSELIRNAVRHGLAGRSGAVAVEIRQIGNKLQCSVADNGCAAIDSPEGRGRALMRALAAELGGSIDWRFSRSGSFASLEIPLSAPI